MWLKSCIVYHSLYLFLYCQFQRRTVFQADIKHAWSWWIIYTAPTFNGWFPKQQRSSKFSMTMLHPWRFRRLTWNLKSTQLKRKIIWTIHLHDFGFNMFISMVKSSEIGFFNRPSGAATCDMILFVTCESKALKHPAWNWWILKKKKAYPVPQDSRGKSPENWFCWSKWYCFWGFPGLCLGSFMEGFSSKWIGLACTTLEV